MKTLLVLLLSFLVYSSTHAQEHMPPAEHPLKGEWKLVFQRSVFETHIDTLLAYGERLPGGDQTKILTTSHFAFGRQSEDGENVTAGGGRYRIEGNKYIEMIDYHTTGALVGTEIPFSWEIKNGKWHHQGHFSNLQLEEVWVRISDQ